MKQLIQSITFQMANGETVHMPIGEAEKLYNELNALFTKTAPLIIDRYIPTLYPNPYSPYWSDTTCQLPSDFSGTQLTYNLSDPIA